MLFMISFLQGMRLQRWCSKKATVAAAASHPHLDEGSCALCHAPYVLYGVKCIDVVVVSLGINTHPYRRSSSIPWHQHASVDHPLERGQSITNHLTWVVRPMFCTGLNI